MMIKYQEKPHRIRVDVSERILRKIFDHRGEISFMFDKRRWKTGMRIAFREIDRTTSVGI